MAELVSLSLLWAWPPCGRFLESPRPCLAKLGPQPGRWPTDSQWRGALGSWKSAMTFHSRVGWSRPCALLGGSCGRVCELPRSKDATVMDGGFLAQLSKKRPLIFKCRAVQGRAGGWSVGKRTWRGHGWEGEAGDLRAWELTRQAQPGRCGARVSVADLAEITGASRARPTTPWAPPKGAVMTGTQKKKWPVMGCGDAAPPLGPSSFGGWGL